MANWKADVKHLRVALERMVHNYTVHAECTKAEAISVAEGILKNMRRNRRTKSPYTSLGPIDPTQTHGKKRNDED